MEEGHFIVGPMGIVRNMTPSANPNAGAIMPVTQFINAPIINSYSDSFIAEWIGLCARKGNRNLQRVLHIHLVERGLP